VIPRRPFSWTRAGAGVAAALLIAPRPAEAHLVTTGLGPVYDGISHLLLSPEDLFPIVALALLAGLRGPAAGRWALFLLPLAWFAGGLAGLYSAAAPPSTLAIPALSFLLLGILVASDLRLPTATIAALALALGFAHGSLNGMNLRTPPASTGVLALLGIMVVLFTLTAIVAALVISLKRPWTRIVVRVAGSWIAAIGLLMLGWAIHGAGPLR